DVCSDGWQTTEALHYAYDDAGNLLDASSDAGAYFYGYDGLNRLTSQIDLWGKTQTYAYDAAGNRTSVQDSLGGVSNSAYDDANRLVSTQYTGQGQAVRIDQAWTDRGQLETVTRYRDTGVGMAQVGETDYAYDLVGRTTQVTHKGGTGSTLLDLGYSY